MLGRGGGGFAGVSEVFRGGVELGDGLPGSFVVFGVGSSSGSANGEVVGFVDFPVVFASGILALFTMRVTVAAGGFFCYGTWASGTSLAF